MTRHNSAKVSNAALADYAPYDEVGTPDDEIEKCDCGVLFRTGDWHLCDDTGERVEWEDYADE